MVTLPSFSPISIGTPSISSTTYADAATRAPGTNIVPRGPRPLVGGPGELAHPTSDPSSACKMRIQAAGNAFAPANHVPAIGLVTIFNEAPGLAKRTGF